MSAQEQGEGRVDLPAALLERTGRVLAVRRPVQGDQSDLLILTAEQGRFVLKRGSTPHLAAEIAREAGVLEALRRYRPLVPEVLWKAEGSEQPLWLLTLVPGEDLVDLAAGADAAGRARLAVAFGEALRLLHGWRPALPVQERWLQEALARAEANVAAGRAECPLGRSRRFAGAEPHQVLERLRRWAPGVKLTPAFTHGDYCMPNVLMEGDQISGIIDWSLGGWRDRRLDLAAGAWSVRYNLKDERYVEAFLRAYGYEGEISDLDCFEALWTLS